MAHTLSLSPSLSPHLHDYDHDHAKICTPQLSQWLTLPGSPPPSRESAFSLFVSHYVRSRFAEVKTWSSKTHWAGWLLRRYSLSSKREKWTQSSPVRLCLSQLDEREAHLSPIHPHLSPATTRHTDSRSPSLKIIEAIACLSATRQYATRNYVCS
ncbi:hypothetical protein K431DRAFT_285987, partial [Polychaeton citri CBS 116435]